jgi:hypothetical protein
MTLVVKARRLTMAVLATSLGNRLVDSGRIASKLGAQPSAARMMCRIRCQQPIAGSAW